MSARSRVCRGSVAVSAVLAFCLIAEGTALAAPPPYSNFANATLFAPTPGTVVEKGLKSCGDQPDRGVFDIRASFKCKEARAFISDFDCFEDCRVQGYRCKHKPFDPEGAKVNCHRGRDGRIVKWTLHLVPRGQALAVSMR